MTQVTKLEPNLPVSLHFVGRGFFPCSRAAKTTSSEESQYESACLLQTTLPSPAPASIRSVKITPTCSMPHSLAVSSTLPLFSHSPNDTPSTSLTCGGS